MGFKVRCTCGKQFGVKDQYRGRKGKCPHCGGNVMLVPVDGDASAPAAPSKDVPEKKPSSGKSSPSPSLAKPPQGAKPEAPPPDTVKAKPNTAKPDTTPRVAIRSDAISIGEDGTDLTSQQAGIRHVVQRFCHVCGTRYNEGADRCSNCMAPLSAEAIAEDAKNKRPPLFPWLPRLNLSFKAKWSLIGLGCFLVMVVLYFLVLFGPMRQKALLQAELAVAEAGLSNGGLQKLLLELPGYPWKRPAQVKASGSWEQGTFRYGGEGTYDLGKRELVLTASDAGKVITHQTTLPPILQVAATLEDVTYLRKLLGNKAWIAKVNEADASGTTALHAAARADRADAVKVLLDHGADSTVRDEKGLTPLSAALGAGSKKAVKLLRQASATDPSKVILMPD